MSQIRLRNVTQSYDDHLVLKEIYLRLGPGQRIGLIGKNGAGKTTLLKLILRQIEPSDGAVELDEGVRVSYFSQFSELADALTIPEVLEQVFAPIHAVEMELRQIETMLNRAPQGAELERLLRRQATLFDEMERRGGWDYARQIDAVLTRLGFSAEHRQRPISQLSGGWRNRAALAKIILEQPDILLLDEPTNFLDVDGLDWLEEWLQAFRGGALIVSHDRDFLDHVVTGIIEIENYHLQEYPGRFEQYIQQKRARGKMLGRQFEHEEELLALEAEAIADRREALRDPAKALKRRLADIKKRVEPKPMDRIITTLYDHLSVPAALCRVERLAKAYDEQALFSDLNLEIQRGDRLAIVGPNGCGKTTLIRVLTGDETPDAGQVIWPKAADWADFNQTFAALDPSDTVSHAVNVVGIAYIAPRRQVNKFLELLQFSEMDLRQPIGSLSGGQRARVALAQCLLSGANVILLDEPTNHLDLTSIQVMERALVCFPGAIVVVSHDRFFIDKVATRLLVFEGQGRVREVYGNWTTYRTSLGR